MLPSVGLSQQHDTHPINNPRNRRGHPCCQEGGAAPRSAPSSPPPCPPCVFAKPTFTRIIKRLAFLNVRRVFTPLLFATPLHQHSCPHELQDDLDKVALVTVAKKTTSTVRSILPSIRYQEMLYPNSALRSISSSPVRFPQGLCSVLVQLNTVPDIIRMRYGREGVPGSSSTYNCSETAVARGVGSINRILPTSTPHADYARRVFLLYQNGV